VARLSDVDLTYKGVIGVVVTINSNTPELLFIPNPLDDPLLSTLFNAYGTLSNLLVPEIV
jgi:hypothetical protein